MRDVAPPTLNIIYLQFEPARLNKLPKNTVDWFREGHGFIRPVIGSISVPALALR